MGGVADGEGPEGFVEADGLGTEGPSAGVFLCGPVLLRFGVDPAVEDGEGVLAAIAEIVEPDEMVDARDLVGELSLFHAEGAGEVVDAPVAVTDADHPDLGVFAHEVRGAGEDGVGNHQVPGLGTEVEDVLGEAFEEAHLLEVDPEGLVVHDVVAAVVAVAVAAGDVPAFEQAVVCAGKGGVDDEVGVLQGLSAVHGGVELEVGADLAGIAAAEPVAGLQAPGVDVHEADTGPLQAGGLTEVLDESEGEDGAPGADETDLHLFHAFLHSAFEEEVAAAWADVDGQHRAGS
jgi:hypothetical protein